MGFWRDFFLGPAPIVSVASPFAPQDSLHQLLVSELYPEHDTTLTLTRDSALRVPAVKRAHDITCGVLAGMPWRQYAGEAEAKQQPPWLVTSDSGIAPRTLRWGVVSDLFMNGWGAIGFAMDEPGKPADAMHVPFGWWSVDENGHVTLDDRIPSRYHDHVAAIPLGYGSNGILNDAARTIRAAQAIESAYQDRVDNPTALTVLTLQGDRWDGATWDEREELRQKWMEGRKSKNGATAMKPDYVTVDFPGTIATDLFENARNGVRLDIANHTGIPAGLLEGSKQGGGTDIKYSGVSNGATRNELWDFGLAKYADAIGGRLSLDDVCPSGESIRVDPSAYLSVPNPTQPQTSED